MLSSLLREHLKNAELSSLLGEPTRLKKLMLSLYGNNFRGSTHITLNRAECELLNAPKKEQCPKAYQLVRAGTQVI